MIEESKALCKAFKPCGPMTVQLIRDNAGGTGLSKSIRALAAHLCR